ncbi:hypothetical protein I3842_01G010600 [Carya illinoinensis]|uniref:Protein kinase domain-containing protein n=1 Tax=Carya illinoinensis TaxID=32201 RepID=A0A922G0C0_CARIL|nr:hypothetical protein I3842_01G010600 [Carya illinoinensis]
MEVLPSHKLLFRLCLFISLHISSLLVLSSAYSPPDNYFINCGAHSNTSVDTRVFIGDRGFLVGKAETVKNSNPTASTSLDLYQAARIFRQQALYKFNIYQTGTYIVRLHFFVFKSLHTDDLRFNVSLPRFSLLTNYSFQNVTSSPKIEEFLLTIPKGEFKIFFVPYQNSSALVNAIEVFLGPESIIPDEAPYITSQGDKNNYSHLSSKVLHKVHRIDVGADSTSKLDELWRNWDQDDKYLQSPKNEVPKLYKVDTPKYVQERITKYIAPAFVYQIARVFTNSSSNFNFPKITWSFPVNKNSKNFLRVHFSDVVSTTANILWFNLSINRNFSKVINPYNITYETGAIPFYIDFVVDSDGLGFVNVSISKVENSTTQNAFLNGLEILEVVNQSGFTPPREIKVGKKKLSPAIIGLACSGAFFILVILVVLGLKYKKPGHDQILKVPLYGGFSSHSWLTQRGPNASLSPSLNLSLRVPFGKLQHATKNFSAKLLIGEGGFGKVYEGTLKDGRKVAVKRSEPGHGQGLEEFQTEIMVLSQIRHRHLVSLIGYCDERREMILVYEFMKNGTLRDHLYHSDNNSEKSTSRSELSWKQRLEICIGAAKGLHYLHTGPVGGIIHRDVKSTNILLDERYVAKVADFGLSKSGLPDLDNVPTGVKGSFGYLDPEYLTTLQLTKKSDVYSFGVVLLEVLCARPVIIKSPNQQEEVNLAEWGMQWQSKGQLERIIDPVLIGKIKPSSLRIFGDIAEKCLRANSTERPTMEDVLYYLNYALRLQATGMPREPFEESTTTTITSLELQLPVVLNFPADEDDNGLIGEDDSSDIEVSEV